MELGMNYIYLSLYAAELILPTVLNICQQLVCNIYLAYLYRCKVCGSFLEVIFRLYYFNLFIYLFVYWCIFCCYLVSVTMFFHMITLPLNNYVTWLDLTWLELQLQYFWLDLTCDVTRARVTCYNTGMNRTRVSTAPPLWPCVQKEIPLPKFPNSFFFFLISNLVYFSVGLYIACVVTMACRAG